MEDFLAKKGHFFWFFEKIYQTVENTGKLFRCFLKSLARPFTKKNFVKIRQKMTEILTFEKTDLLRLRIFTTSCGGHSPKF